MNSRWGIVPCASSPTPFRKAKDSEPRKDDPGENASE
jgi:hypothetical protein